MAETLQERIERAKQEMEDEKRTQPCTTQEVACNTVAAPPPRRRSSGSGSDLPSPKKKKIGPTLPPWTTVPAGEEDQGGGSNRDMVGGWEWECGTMSLGEWDGGSV